MPGKGHFTGPIHVRYCAISHFATDDLGGGLEGPPCVAKAGRT